MCLPYGAFSSGLGFILLAAFKQIMSISQKQRFTQYEFMPEINVKFLQYQRITGTLSGSTMSFMARRPLPNVILSAKAYIKWTVPLNRVEITSPTGVPVVGAGNNFPPNRNETALYLKPFMVMANATASATVSINGHTLRYQEPTDWMKYLGQMFGKESIIQKYFSTCGGAYPNYLGSYDNQFQLNNQVGDAQANADDNIQASQLTAGVALLPALGVGPVATFNFLEPLAYGPFNPWFDSKDELSDCSWFKHMSDTIPYVNDIDVTVQLEKVAANIVNYMYTLAPADDTTSNRATLTEQLENITAELVLQWVCPSDSPGIPPVVSLPSWQVDSRSFEINAGVAVEDDFLVQFASDYIHYHTVPSYLLFFASRDKSAAGYLCRSVLSDSDGLEPPADQTFSLNVDSMEPNMRMENMVLTLDVNNTVVNLQWSPQELYNITAKNCTEIPYDFRATLGGLQYYAALPGNTFALFRPEDLNVKWGAGHLRHDFTLRVDSELRGATGFSLQANRAATNVYRYHIVLFYHNYFIEMGRDGVVNDRLLNYFH